MTHDPATLAAVREAIANYRGAVNQHLTPTEAYNLGKVDAMKAVASLAAPPQPPKRVEAWLKVCNGCIVDQAATPRPQSRSDGDGWVYVTHFPGVTDAASAEAFERALAAAALALKYIAHSTVSNCYSGGPHISAANRDTAEEARKALAPFLPPVPR